MSSAQVGAILRHLRKQAAAWEDHELPDHELLERFARHRDENAFAVLLGRHGSMVLGVCRSVLHDLHDAEDAFQAAFLLLSQKAGSIHRREAVSGWLYRVAYHLALRAGANAARRKIVEKRALTMPSADPLLDMSLREVRAVLFEELEALPEQNRSPLVLCGLEEKSLDEAAHLLGWTHGAVKGRLQRGRELLRARLTRRGLELPAALSAIALALGSSSPLSAALADSTLRAAVKMAAGGAEAAGAVSAQVAALVQGASQTMFYSKAKIATTLVLAVSLALTAFGVVRLRAQSAHQPALQQTVSEKPKDKSDRTPADAKPKPAEEGTIEVRGRVLDPEGKPVAGARLYLAKQGPNEPAPSEQATSGPDGCFRFTAQRAKMDKSSWQVMAVATGHGCDWAAVGSAKTELTLRLVKDVPIRGRILDREGRPVAGVKVRVLAVAAYEGEDLTKMVDDFRRVGYQTSEGVKRWYGPLPGQSSVVTVGADGRIRLSGFGRERTVRLSVEGPTIEYATVIVMTRHEKTLVGWKPPQGYRQGKIYGATFDYLPAPARLIRGVVRDKATGKPVPGVTFWTYLTPHRPVTDAKGRFELLGYPKTSTYILYLVPPDGHHFAIRTQIPDTQGLDPITADIDLPSGITVKGQALDKNTGKPVVGVRVSYFVLFPNPKVGKLDGYHEYEGLSRATTGPDGSYTITVLPGPGVLAVEAQPASSYRSALITPKELETFLGQKLPNWLFPSQDHLAIHGTGAVANARNMLLSQSRYNDLVLINPKEKDTPLVRDLVLLPALKRQGTIVAADGTPLSGVNVIGLNNPHSNEFNATLKSASFTVHGLHPMRTRDLFFYHKEKNLGRYLELRGDQGEPLKVELQPCGSVAGRLVDKAGKAVAGTVIYVCRKGNGAFWPGGFQVKTDKDGRFHVESLVPGQPYTLTRQPSNIADTLPRGVTVEPGKKKDLGDLVVAPLPR
jgi:RNA polymerase sigma factor (sigma-70 family)